MHPYRPWLFRAAAPWHQLPATTAPFRALRSPTHYRGWRVTFSPTLIRLDVESLRQGGHRLDTPSLN